MQIVGEKIAFFGELYQATKDRYGDDRSKQRMKKQAESGAVLSDKQLAALKRMAIKYRDQLTNQAKVFDFFQIDTAELDENDNNASVSSEKIADSIEKLNKITEWAAPEKKGRFVFDDKKFFQSLAKQFADKKQLSDKQIAALDKLVAKYVK